MGRTGIADKSIADKWIGGKPMSGKLRRGNGGWCGSGALRGGRDRLRVLAAAPSTAAQLPPSAARYIRAFSSQVKPPDALRKCGQPKT